MKNNSATVKSLEIVSLNKAGDVITLVLERKDLGEEKAIIGDTREGKPSMFDVSVQSIYKGGV